MFGRRHKGALAAEERTFAGGAMLRAAGGSFFECSFFECNGAAVVVGMFGLSPPRLLWYGLLAGTSGILALALLPPFLPPEVGGMLSRAFAPACHQMPARSPHIGGVPIAICDRCTGIYAGLVLGVLGTGWGRSLWHRFGPWRRYVLLGAFVPLGLDWAAPLVGLWPSVPLSRALTGLLFGGVAASYMTHRLRRRAVRAMRSGDAAASLG